MGGKNTKVAEPYYDRFFGPDYFRNVGNFPGNFGQPRAQQVTVPILTNNNFGQGLMPMQPQFGQMQTIPITLQVRPAGPQPFFPQLPFNPGAGFRQPVTVQIPILQGFPQQPNFGNFGNFGMPGFNFQQPQFALPTMTMAQPAMTLPPMSSPAMTMMPQAQQFICTPIPQQQMMMPQQQMMMPQMQQISCATPQPQVQQISCATPQPQIQQVSCAQPQIQPVFAQQQCQQPIYQQQQTFMPQQQQQSNVKCFEQNFELSPQQYAMYGKSKLKEYIIPLPVPNNCVPQQQQQYRPPPQHMMSGCKGSSGKKDRSSKK